MQCFYRCFREFLFDDTGNADIRCRDHLYVYLIFRHCAEHCGCDTRIRFHPYTNDSDTLAIS